MMKEFRTHADDEVVEDTATSDLTQSASELAKPASPDHKETAVSSNDTVCRL